MSTLHTGNKGTNHKTACVEGAGFNGARMAWVDVSVMCLLSTAVILGLSRDKIVFLSLVLRMTAGMRI